MPAAGVIVGLGSDTVNVGVTDLPLAEQNKKNGGQSIVYCVRKIISTISSCPRKWIYATCWRRRGEGFRVPTWRRAVVRP